MAAVLFILGALLQFLGIGLIAAPDLVPFGLRAAGWSRRRWRVLENYVRPLVGLRPREIVVHGAATITGTARIRAARVVETDAEELEGQVAFLLRRDRDSQLLMNRLLERISVLETVTERGFADLQDELKDHVTDSLAAAQADDRWTRVGGAIALAMGLALTTWASLL